MLTKPSNYNKLMLCALLLSGCAVHKSSPASSIKGEGTLKVMTYNIHHANPPSKAKEGLIDVDAIAAVIRAQQPDVVGLQELDRNTKRSGNIDETALIGQKTGMYYHFFKAIDHDGGDYGLAILSKYPLKDAGQLALPQVTKGEARILSYATISIPGAGKITFANTHLDAQRPDSNRIVQMQRIIQELGTKTGPVILTGDLNSEASKEAIHILDRSFKRSCISGCPLTIPETRPTKTIDYIAIKNAGWQVKTHTVIEETYASDHRPVVATFQIK